MNVNSLQRNETAWETGLAFRRRHGPAPDRLVVWQNALRSGRETEALLAALVAQRTVLAADVQRAEARLAAAERTRAALAASWLGPSAARVTPAPAPAPVRTMSELIANDPTLEVYELRRQRAAVGQDYGYFFQKLGLSPEQIARFTDNQLKYVERWTDLSAVARAQDAAGRQTVVTLQARSKEEHEAAQVALLGAEAFGQLQEHERTTPVRNVIVRGLAGVAALEGIPVTPEQGDRLFLAALAASGSDAKAKGEQIVAMINWSALDAQAQQILTPAQFALFKKVAPPSGFSSRWKFELDAAIRRAKAADGATVKSRG